MQTLRNIPVTVLVNSRVPLTFVVHVRYAQLENALAHFPEDVVFRGATKGAWIKGLGRISSHQ